MTEGALTDGRWLTRSLAHGALVCLLCNTAYVSAVESSDPTLTEEIIEGWEAAEPEAEAGEDENQDGEVNWVDTSHAYATGRAQAMTRWMDDYFGDKEYILEEAESQLRLELIDTWDSDDGTDLKVRLRGKLQLPKISRRLNLLFSGEDSELDSSEERQVNDEIGLQYELLDRARSRFDLTLGYSSGHLRPGVKYRNQGSFSDRLSYRLVERIQYEDGENFFSQTQFDLNHAVGENSVVRWGSRLLYGEKTEGVEWSTGLSLRQRYRLDHPRPIATSYFVSANGVTRPEGFSKNYRTGVLWRRQVYRDYLFLELEPSYNYRRRNYDDERDGAWRMIVRVEIALQRNLARVAISKSGEVEDDL
ncbi:hypothetical protein FV139_00240 [Parahaliea maris]|uniref:DUF560 domain-containing protein n=1 Tax=Parahaliea maris TaxID=2716870 RepID=A0A5C9A5C0_9GAMM|nr:hypothetical protein [Parahaliea maris]TXS95978.1 hypothetical protein FV139_00240 [Parahaliea maris]